jgi:hypothetical protein
MATSTCATPIKGTHLRIVALDTCGVPVTGASGLVAVSRGFISVAMAPDYEDGEEFFERNASGQACVNQKDDPTLKRLGLTIDWCEVMSYSPPDRRPDAVHRDTGGQHRVAVAEAIP